MPPLSEDRRLTQDRVGAQQDEEIVIDGPEMDNNEGWLDTEKEENEKLMTEGFSAWTKKDFSVFKSACERHGRSAYDAIAQELETKTPEEVRTEAARGASIHKRAHTHTHTLA